MEKKKCMILFRSLLTIYSATTITLTKNSLVLMHFLTSLKAPTAIILELSNLNRRNKFLKSIHYN